MPDSENMGPPFSPEYLAQQAANQAVSTPVQQAAPSVQSSGSSTYPISDLYVNPPTSPMFFPPNSSSGGSSSTSNSSASNQNFQTASQAAIAVMNWFGSHIGMSIPFLDEDGDPYDGEG